MYINEIKQTTDIVGGNYSFHLKSGAFNISIKSNNIYFKSKIINVDISGSGIFSYLSLPTQSLLQLAQFEAISFDVCGSVQIKPHDETQTNLKNSIKIKFKSENHMIFYANLNDSMKFCIRLKGNFVVTTEQYNLNLIIPAEKKIKVYKPILDLDFDFYQDQATSSKTFYFTVSFFSSLSYLAYHNIANQNWNIPIFML